MFAKERIWLWDEVLSKVASIHSASKSGPGSSCTLGLVLVSLVDTLITFSSHSSPTSSPRVIVPEQTLVMEGGGPNRYRPIPGLFSHTVTYFSKFSTLKNPGSLSSFLQRVILDPPFSLKSPVVKTTILWNITKTPIGGQTNWPHTVWLPL